MGRQAGRQKGKQCSTWWRCHNSPPSISLSELHTPALPLAKPVFAVWGPRSRLFSLDTKVTLRGSTPNWLPPLLVKCAVLPNLLLTKTGGDYPGYSWWCSFSLRTGARISFTTLFLLFNFSLLFIPCLSFLPLYSTYTRDHYLVNHPFISRMFKYATALNKRHYYSQIKQVKKESVWNWF